MWIVMKSNIGITTKNDRIDPCIVGIPHHHVFMKTTWVLGIPFAYLWNLISQMSKVRSLGQSYKVCKSLKFALHLKLIILIAVSIVCVCIHYCLWWISVEIKNDININAVCQYGTCARSMPNCDYVKEAYIYSSQ